MFFEIIHLKNETLYQLLTILNEINKGLSYNELELCRDDIERGIYDIKWIIDKNNLSKRVKNAFEQHKNRIPHQHNIAEAFKLAITDFYQAKQISADFLNALDFYNLNNEDYFLALLFCMKVSIQNFELEQEPVLEFFIFFLSDHDRVEIADKDIAEIVTTYLILLKTLRSLYCFNKKDQACLNLWETRLTYFKENANQI